MAQEGLDTLLAKYEFLVTYTPLPTEAAFVALLPQDLDTYSVPQHPDRDPTSEAQKSLLLADRRRTAVLLPGAAFDIFGTRHGRGGGWYDRFLANAPHEWLRIGFCYTEQLSRRPLTRESWDQPVDFVYVVDKETYEGTLYETRARTASSDTLEA